MCYYRSVRNVIIYQRSFEKVIDRATRYLNMLHNVVSAINAHNQPFWPDDRHKVI